MVKETKTVLIVDDDENITRTFARISRKKDSTPTQPKLEQKPYKKPMPNFTL